MTFSPPAHPPGAPPVPATLVDDPHLIDHRNGKARKASKRVRKAIALMLTGECTTLKAASVRAGLSCERLSRALGEPHVSAYVQVEKLRRLAEGSLRAVPRLIELLDSKSDHVSLDASAHLLGIDGIKPVEKGASISINQNAPAGYIINLSGSPPTPEDLALGPGFIHRGPAVIDGK